MTIVDFPIVQREYVTHFHSICSFLYSLFEDALGIREYITLKSA